MQINVGMRDSQMRNSLISIFAGTGLSLASSGLALAADMVVKAPPPPAPVYGWTGFYVGGNIGYSWGKASGDLNDPAIAFFSGLGSLPTSFSESLKPKGAIAGGQFGYNCQINPTWVVGLEADLQTSDEHARSSQSASTGGASAGGSTSSTVDTTFEGRISWFGTARARTGCLLIRPPTTLLYGTGGFAFGGAEVSGSGAVNINLTACIPGIGFVFPPAARVERLRLANRRSGPAGPWAAVSKAPLRVSGLGRPSIFISIWDRKVETLRNW